MKALRSVLLVIQIVAFFGCSVHHYAEPTGFPEGIPAGRSTERVTIRNAQPDTKPAQVGSLGMYGTMYADFSQWTDAAIALLKEKLTDTGMTVTSAAPKTLSLAVTDAQIGYTGGGWAWKCAVTIKVEGANGLNATFVGERASWKYQRVCDAGLAEAVANVLRNEIVLAYLGYRL